MSRPAYLRIVAAQTALVGVIAISATWGQSPEASPATQTDFRAIAVYEYTGDLKKPEKSRLVPVSVWDGTQLQPGSLYLADPEPLAVESGTLYQLEQDGNPKGLIDVKQADQIASGWVGLGAYEPMPPPQMAQLHVSKNLSIKDDDPYTPHFAYRPPPDTGVAGSTPRTGKNAPPPDPDRPTLHDRTGDAGASSTADSNRSSDDDLDRPTLHRHLSSTPSFSNNIAPDPNRPRLHYGAPATEEKLDKIDALISLPPDMHQMIAVSDAQDKQDHSYTWSWPSAADEETTKNSMEDLARKLLAPEPPAAQATARNKASRTSAHRTSSHKTHAKKPSPPPPLPLTDEDFRAFELSWGAGPVYVLTARTDVPEAQTKYIALIAKPDFSGNLLILFKKVTPADLLDYQPRLHLVDAVDATGDRRADLLFDLRTRNSRQFALYSVAGSEAELIFTTAPQQ